MTTLNTAANEQMREKARLLLSKALVKIHPEGVIVRTDLNEAAAEVLAAALTEAHAAGRQEIVAKLPSEREWMKHLDTELAMHHMLEAVSLENIWRVALYRLQVELEKK